jgi:ferric-dicitrate binding protein FerR (iron transport regulator)
MNDQTAGWFPDDDDQDDGEQRQLRSHLERQLMDRARRAAERDQEKPPRRVAQHTIAAAAALGLVLVIALGFDAFLTSMQKVMRMLDEEEAKQKQQQEQAPPDPTEPMPAYVVPED